MHPRLDVGATLDEIFRIYRDQAGVLLAVALVLFAVQALVTGVLTQAGLVLALVGAALQIVASTFYQGMVVRLVEDVQDGRRDSSVGDLLRSVSGSVSPLVGAGILAALGIVVGFVLFIVPGLILLTLWAVIAPVIVIERAGALAAFGRSRELVRGNGWQVFGVIAVLVLLALLLSALVGAAAASGNESLRIFLNIVVSVLTAPLVALAAGVLYFRLLRVQAEEQDAGPVGEARQGVAPERPGGFPG
jgi:hypothetical protein